MKARRVNRAGAGEFDLKAEQQSTDYETKLFTRVVSIAEKEGKPVEFLVVPGVVSGCGSDSRQSPGLSSGDRCLDSHGF